MGKRRRNLFVLLFVFGLILVSGIVIANKPTKLGLDLKGGVQLVLQGRPTPQQPTLDNGSMEKAVDIIRSGCDQLGVSEIEVARVGSDQIQVGIPGATSVGRLLWRGGLSMKANSRSFGGWSDLHVAPDGRTLTSISSTPLDGLSMATEFPSVQSIQVAFSLSGRIF